MANEPKNKKNVDIELPAEQATGSYANLAMITHSPEEFIMDFIAMMPGMPKGRVTNRIILTPSHARRLLAALKDNIERYEKSHGPIEDRPGPEERALFGGGMGGVA
ncbi:MAG: DUF3467 domain-containing protein [Bacteroidetes bacterium]|jgi:hypothetical protein|nr:DUF3467 domain-containing protein [Bacteroidota bacterium]